MTRKTGSRYLAEALDAYGLTHVFMVPTVAVRALAEMDSLGIVGVMAHGEKAAAYMADGYARVNRAPGMCLAQTIGAANLAAGLRDAAMAGSPVVAVTGGTTPATRGKGVYQEIEDFPIFEQLTKYNMQLGDVNRLPDLLRQTIREAVSGSPGPVHLELQGLAGSVLDAELEVDEIAEHQLAEARFAGVPPFRPGPEAEAVDAVVELLAKAERPVIVAGGGVRMSGAQAQLAALVERCGVPVATSMNGKGVLDETGPHAVGVVGASSRQSANQTVERADLVIFIGTRTGSQVTDNWRLPARGTTVVQIDIDPAQLGRNYPNTVSIQADAAAAIEALIAALPDGPAAARVDWVTETARYVTAWREQDGHLLGHQGPEVRPERICREITDFLPGDGVLVVDTGHAGIWAASMIDMRPTQTFIRAAGSLGWSLPASIGAKAAAGDRTVVCFTGDGGLYYHLSEIETAVRHGLAPIIVVNDNLSLSQDMKIFQHSWGGSDRITEAGDRMWRFTGVDLAEVARQLGAWTVRVEDPADLSTALKEAQQAGRIAIVDVITSPDALPAVPHGGRDFYAPADKS
ncbi:thiamine pyrophosphate-binding protein [Nakamurella leprariae]|uniref:Thiamine pyrophosphate-binding protein n=1 Tax=Nakamurella leprariae TaxID=2803911 RepID=A0A939BUV8_9ACTN|nr:thiamine pyrophosphate-binding protein [Nakamurella leprariae]MBM9465923.1 thiamine pyrophosphate-binding protein [Nakamurella leprariae]